MFVFRTRGVLFTFFFVLAIVSSPLQAQNVALSLDKALDEFLLTQWTNERLPTDVILDIQQSVQGDLWITSYSGLIRFDGRTFESFDRDELPLMRTRGVTSVYPLPDGTMWVGSQGDGLFRYADGRFELFDPLDDQATTPEILDIHVDREGTLWLGTGNHGVYRYPGGRRVPVEIPELRGIAVGAIEEDRRGVIWFAAENNGLVGVDGDSVRIYDVDSGLRSNRIRSLHAVADGLWIANEQGLEKFEPTPGQAPNVGVVRSIPELEGIAVDRVRADDLGGLWLSTREGLMRRRAGGRVETLDRYRGQLLRELAGLEIDREGSVWFSGNAAGGLFQLRDGRFTNYGPQDGLATERVASLCELADGDVLVGTDNGTVHRIHDGVVSGYPIETPFVDAQVRDIEQDADGAVWISSNNGLLRIIDDGETRTEKLFTPRDGLPTDHVRLVLATGDRRLWVATGSGVALGEPGDDGEMRFRPVGSGLARHLALSLAEDPQGRILAGVRGGLAVLSPEGETLEEYTFADGLPGSVVFQARSGPSGAIWVNTNNGLARLHGGAIRVLGEGEGLPADSTYDLAFDASGGVWLSSGIGVIHVAAPQLDEYMDDRRSTVEAVLYDHRDGMISRSCVGARKMLQTRDGELWFPTMGGVAILDPVDLGLNVVPPPVEIRRLRIDDVPFPLQDGMLLPPGGRRFEFDVSVLSLTVPSKVKVRYRLEGLDSDWIDAGAARSVRYASLPPGEYTLRVIAANSDGIWNPDGDSLRFEVSPFFHETPLFFVLVALALILGVSAVHFWRLRIVRSEAEARLRLIRELEAKNDEMSRFTHTVSHDLKSPLFTIRGFLFMLLKDMEAGREESARKSAERIDTAVDRMAQLLEDLLKLSQAGSSTRELEEIPFGEIAREAIEMVTARIEQAGVRVAVAPDLPAVKTDRVRMRQVLQNLIDNAVKFMGDQETPRIEIGARRETIDGREQTVFFVRDNGRGMAEEDLERVFELFKRLQTEAEGTGVGLAIVKRVIDVHGGKVWAESDGIGHGSAFCFTIGRR